MCSSHVSHTMIPVVYGCTVLLVIHVRLSVASSLGAFRSGFVFLLFKAPAASSIFGVISWSMPGSTSRVTSRRALAAAAVDCLPVVYPSSGDDLKEASAARPKLPPPPLLLAPEPDPTTAPAPATSAASARREHPSMTISIASPDISPHPHLAPNVSC